MRHKQIKLLAAALAVVLTAACGQPPSNAAAPNGSPENAGNGRGELLTEAGDTLPEGAEAVTVTFHYSKQQGYSSNQFAVWVEDENNNFIKTLYATEFTAAGGWEERPFSLPLWVTRAGLAEPGAEQADAVSGPTPNSGEVVCLWDCTDADGERVADGAYNIFVEGTLRQENSVVYSAPVAIGDAAAQTAAVATYYGDSESERGMLDDVLVAYRPGK